MSVNSFLYEGPESLITSNGLECVVMIDFRSLMAFDVVIFPNSHVHRKPVALSTKMINFFSPTSHQSVPKESIGLMFMTMWSIGIDGEPALCSSWQTYQLSEIPCIYSSMFGQDIYCFSINIRVSIGRGLIWKTFFCLLTIVFLPTA